MGKYKKLGVNIVTFFVGNMGSRLIQFIFIPMYTYWLTTYEYGIIDTVVITVSLCCPLVSMSIHDALLRFLLEHDGKENEYYSASLFLGAIGSLFFLLSAFVFNSIDLLRPYWLYFYIYMVLSVFFYIQNSLIRGLEYNKLYSGLGVINTLLQALCILLLVGKFRLGIDGYLMSMIIAYASSLLVSIFATKSWNYFSTKYISKCQIQSMLMYSLPLVPNAMMWWVINSSDKYMILYFLSPEANGVFAIASKIPLVINVAYSIFLMAWQISVVEERNQEGKENFYHMIYLCMISGLFIFASFIMIFIKPAILTFLSDGYNETWKYIPLLLISAIFTCLAGYYGSFYVAFKKTGGALKTSMVCAMVSICLNLFLIRYIGLLGVAMSNLISFLTLYVYRIIDTKRFLIIKPESVLVLCNTAILITQTFIIYFLDGYVAFLILIFLFVLMTFINRSLLVKIVAILKEIVQKNIMERIQYNVIERDTKNASGKAKKDVGNILRINGFKNLYNPLEYRYFRVMQQLWSISRLKSDICLFVQYPANIQICYNYLKSRKGFKICIIHDLESLRGTKTVKEEISVLNSFNIVISHNEKMSQYLRSNGLVSRIVELDIFDYLLPVDLPINVTYRNNEIAFAGNLEKSMFLKRMGELQDFKVNLYGAPISDMQPIVSNRNIDYKGCFSSEDLISHLSGGWGLVWDGDSLDCCNGIAGEYMRYNCPHKVSMYIVSERPIIIWNQAAMADYVVKHNLGIKVSSLHNLQNIISSFSSDEYNLMVRAVKAEKMKLSVGGQLQGILNSILNQ